MLGHGGRAPGSGRYTIFGADLDYVWTEVLSAEAIKVALVFTVRLGFNYILIVCVSLANGIIHRFLSQSPQYMEHLQTHVSRGLFYGGIGPVRM